MARRKKPSGRNGSGPWTRQDIERALRAEGWVPAKNGGHLNFEHPDRGGKVSMSPGWTSVRMKHLTFAGLVKQTGLSRRELRDLLNKHRR